jgi:hypothetical protein
MSPTGRRGRFGAKAIAGSMTRAEAERQFRFSVALVALLTLVILAAVAGSPAPTSHAYSVAKEISGH